MNCKNCESSFNKANEVHHLTYDYFENEPLYTLISLCKECHDLITKIDRNDK